MTYPVTIVDNFFEDPDKIVELTETLKLSCIDQMNWVTTFIEVILNQELGEPFRRDAMKAPVEVAGIDSKDTVVK